MVVFDRTMLANANRDEILGHEFGHYSKEDNKTGIQTIANYSGDKLEDKTKGMVAKEATEDTLAAIRNNKNVITGEEGKKLADSIPMDRREYLAVGISGSISGSFIGSGSLGKTKFIISNKDFSKFEYARTFDLEVGFGTPTLGTGGSFVLLFNVYESKDLESGKSYVAGGSLGPIGGDFIFDEDFKIVGFKVSLSKSKNLPEYAFKNILTKAEGHARISTSTVRKSKVIFQEKRIEDNLKNLQKLYDKEEKKITDMEEFMKLVNQLKKDIEVLSDTYEK